MIDLVELHFIWERSEFHFTFTNVLLQLYFTKSLFTLWAQIANQRYRCGDISELSGKQFIKNISLPILLFIFKKWFF